MTKARDLADGTFSGAFSADSPTLVVDDANDRAGVGTTNPQQKFHIENSANSSTWSYVTNGNSGTGAGAGILFGTDQGAAGALFQNSSGNTDKAVNSLRLRNLLNAPIVFETNATERARIDSSGNLLVGHTSAFSPISNGGSGCSVMNNGQLFAAHAGTPLYINREDSDGSIAEFRKDGAAVGSIGVDGVLFINSQGSSGYLRNAGTTEYIWSASAFRPNGDNTSSIGAAGDRFTQLYAASGTINTSDATEKQDVVELDEAEKRVATTAKGLIRKFRWVDAVEAKGDDARIHVGVIAQDLKAAFEAEGLDAHRYGMFCSDTWWEAEEVVPAVEEVLDEEGNVITEAQPERTEKRTYYTAEEAPEGAVERTRLGVRYPELLAFIIGAM